MMFDITYFENVKHNTGTRVPFTSFDDLCSELKQESKRIITKKENNNLFTLTTFCFDKRNAKAANPTKLFALDFDDERNTIEQAIEVFDFIDCNYFLYTSHSHKKEHHKFRIVLEMSEAIKDQEENNIVFKLLADELEKDGLFVDRACPDISRLWYFPCTANEALPCFTHKGGHQPFDIPTEEMDWDRQVEAHRELQRKLYLESLPKKRKKNGAGAIKWAVDNFEPSHKGIGKFVGFLLLKAEIPEDEIRNVFFNEVNYTPKGPAGQKEKEFKHWLDWYKKKGV